MRGPVEAGRRVGAGDVDVAQLWTLALLGQVRRAGARVCTRAVDDAVGARIDNATRGRAARSVRETGRTGVRKQQDA